MLSSVDFDRVLEAVGGRHQFLLFFVLCIPATVPVAFLTFSNVFISATPDHWCAPPPLYARLNLSQEALKGLLVPQDEKCRLYDVNETHMLKATGNLYNNVDDLVEDANHDSLVMDQWVRNFTKLVRDLGAHNTAPCKWGWVYDKSQYDRTLVTESNLVCDNDWWAGMNMSMFYVGSLFGNIIFGWIADRWGRRRSILFMIFLEVPLAILPSFFTNYTVYIVFRVFGGFFFPALYQIPFVLGIEMMAPKHRTFSGLIICTLFALAMCLLSLLAFLLRDWYKLSLAISVPFVVLFGYYWILPESPRWLFSQGRLDEAEEILEKIAKYNGVTIPKKYLHQLQEEYSEKCNQEIQHKSNASENSSKELIRRKSHEHQGPCDDDKINNKARPSTYPMGNESFDRDLESLITNKPDVILKNEDIIPLREEVRSIALQTDPVLVQEGTLLDIFRYPNIKKKFLLTTFIWVVNGVVYNGLSYNTSNLGVNDYLAFFISAIIEIPSYVLAYLLMEKWGRRCALTITLAIGSIGCVAYVFIPEDFLWAGVSSVMAGKFGISASFAVFYVFSGELIPTVIRSQALGLALVVVSVGLLTPASILRLSQYFKVLPFVIFGTLTMMACVASIFLPETLNTPMPQTLEDGEEFGKNFKILSVSNNKKYVTDKTTVTNL